jgi:multidrug efflux pump subunit AcrA (membrane-fusion protein)
VPTRPSGPPLPGPHSSGPPVVRPVVFPPSVTEGTPTKWRRWFFSGAAGLVVVALVSGVVLARVASSSTVSYRTAAAGEHDVESVLTGVGSIEPVSQATVAFPISGTVATVDVAVGDTVGTGQPLATLGTQSLTDSLHQAQTTLASAELTLSKALAGTSSSTSSTSSASSSGSGSSSTTSTTTASSGSPSHGGSGSGSGSLAAAQQAVVAGQQAVDAALATADQALAASAQVCAAVTGQQAIAGVQTPAASTTTTTTADGSAASSITACQTALLAVSDAQTAVASAQTSLAKASSDLDTLLAQQASSATSSTGSTGSSRSSTASGSSGSSASTGTRSGAGSSTGSTGGSSSSDLIADQKAIDAATAEVAVAQQNLAQSAIVSPIAGLVAAVTLTVGSTVTAASTTATVVVVGTGGLEVTIAVSVDQVPDVKVGQAATVLPDGATDPIAGQVVAISLTPATSTRGTTYRVTIGLDGQGAGLGNGATGTVVIRTAGVTSALAVPTSAILHNGTNHSVTVLDGATTSTVDVKVGVIGSSWTQITDGLAAGQLVVLANLDHPLPGSATSASNGSTTNTRAGGFVVPTGAGGPPAGFTPGGR